ncbi:polyadenylation and cleavage factor homolog 4-like isoform X2 [Tripterygium wilfordii]|nr:polyadenylation and cleavage factor homolog 4-like isoform X2 [Tripterygium wilfordii]
MRHLFGTWSKVFPPSVLRKIETQLQFSSSVNNQSSGLTPLRSFESPRPTHGIHVNPKYLRQLDHSAADTSSIQRARGASLTLNMYNQKPSIGDDECDSDHAGHITTQVGAQRLKSTGSLGLTDVNKMRLSSTSRLSRPLSPSRIGADVPLSLEADEYSVDNSPRRFIEVASPSNRAAINYGFGKGIGGDEETNEWQRRHYTDGGRYPAGASFRYSLSNGKDHPGPRALIDAYGTDRGKGTSNSLEAEGDKVGSRSWQHTEEEEFDWEDMSPTLTGRGRSNDFLRSSVPTLGGVGARPGFGKLGASAAPLESRIRNDRSGQLQQRILHGSSNVTEDAVPNSARGLPDKINRFPSEPNRVSGARYSQEAWNFPHHFSQSSHHLNAKGRVPDADTQHVRPSVVASGMGSSHHDSLTVGSQSVVPSSTGAWPPVNVHNFHPPRSPTIPPMQTHIDYTNSGNTVMNQGLNKSLFRPEQQYNGFGSKGMSSTKPPSLIDQHASMNLQNQAQEGAPLQPQFIASREARENFPSVSPSAPRFSSAPPLYRGYNLQGHNAAISMVPTNPIPTVQLPLVAHNIPNSSFYPQWRGVPPLPSRPPPSSQMITNLQVTGSIASNQLPGSAYSGLISTLMAQGLISLTGQNPVQEPVGLEFNADLLKVRYESAINALYGDLPRQCTTCGLRFRCQEQHSSHMDWHVTKNRNSKNRKQKPSRKWFVSTSMWLSGAEALGTEAVPGFLPTQTVEEKKDDEELAVPADEDHNLCALCGEPFEEFYSDETEEWMYKGAVYLNAPNGSTSSVDGSQAGPIVHAKCRPDSSIVPPEDFGHDDGGNNEEGSQRKRMRS